jgi:hypothetical protein
MSMTRIIGMGFVLALLFVAYKFSRVEPAAAEKDPNAISAVVGDSHAEKEAIAESEKGPPELVGAWIFTGDGSTEVFVFDANGEYRLLSKDADTVTIGEGEWKRDGKKLALSGGGWIKLAGEWSGVDGEGSEDTIYKLDHRELVLGKVTYRRIAREEAMRRFPPRSEYADE